MHIQDKIHAYLFFNTSIKTLNPCFYDLIFFFNLKNILEIVPNHTYIALKKIMLHGVLVISMFVCTVFYVILLVAICMVSLSS